MIITHALFAVMSEQAATSWTWSRAAPPADAFTACFLCKPVGHQLLGSSWRPLSPPYHSDNNWLQLWTEREVPATLSAVNSKLVQEGREVYRTAVRIRSLEIVHPQTAAAAAAADREAWVFPHSLSCCCFILCCRASLTCIPVRSFILTLIRIWTKCCSPVIPAQAAASCFFFSLSPCANVSIFHESYEICPQNVAS